MKQEGKQLNCRKKTLTGQHSRLQNLPLLCYFHKSGSSVPSQTDFSRYVAAFLRDRSSRTPEGCKRQKRGRLKAVQSSSLSLCSVKRAQHSTFLHLPDNGVGKSRIILRKDAREMFAPCPCAANNTFKMTRESEGTGVWGLLTFKYLCSKKWSVHLNEWNTNFRNLYSH